MRTHLQELLIYTLCISVAYFITMPSSVNNSIVFVRYSWKLLMHISFEMSFVVIKTAFSFLPIRGAKKGTGISVFACDHKLISWHLSPFSLCLCFVHSNKIMEYLNLGRTHFQDPALLGNLHSVDITRRTGAQFVVALH